MNKDISPGIIDYQQKEYRSKNQELVGVKYSPQDRLQGGFSIRDVGGSHGDTAKIEKNVWIVTTITLLKI